MNESITKKKLWQYVNKKIEHSINHAHVFSVICILFEEIIIEILKKGELKVVNFGVLKLKSMNPRKYHDVRHQKVMYSEGNKIFRFTPSPKLRKKLCENLDLDGTFGSD